MAEKLDLPIEIATLEFIVRQRITHCIRLEDTRIELICFAVSTQDSDDQSRAFRIVQQMQTHLNTERYSESDCPIEHYFQPSASKENSCRFK